jgi:hypothetical protein
MLPEQRRDTEVHDLTLVSLGFILGAIVASIVLVVLAAGVAAGGHVKH